jgi:hypothetical protein
MRVPTITKQLAAIAAFTMFLAACGGPSVEGRYVGRGDTFFDSLTFGANGRAEVVLIGVTHPASYVLDGDSITLTAPNGTESRFVVGNDGCLTHAIVGTFCRDGSAPATLGAAAASVATGGSEAYEAVTQEGRIRLEILSESQARMIMRPNAPGGNGMPAQMSLDLYYERDGDDMILALPGDDPMQLLRDGRDFVASMNGETARFVRQ